MTDPTSKESLQVQPLTLTDAATIRRLAALEAGERAEVRLVMKEQPSADFTPAMVEDHYEDGSTESLTWCLRNQSPPVYDMPKSKDDWHRELSPFGPPGTRLRIIAPSTMPLRITEMQALKNFTTIDCRVEQVDGVWVWVGTVEKSGNGK